MTFKACLTHLLVFPFAITCLAEDPLPTLHWKTDTQRLLVEGATYGRMKSLTDGIIVCSYEKAATSWVMRSDDGGQTWSPGVLAGGVDEGTAANPEMCVLTSGTLLCFFNERPKTHGEKRKFSIRMSRSDDGGKTWTARPTPLFEGGNTMAEGCWEPAALEMPDGEIRLFFAHELPGQQEIVLMTSRDAGTTWSPPSQVSLRPNRRDGMPVPCLLQDNRLVFSVEDNGIAGQDRPHPPFRPSIIDYEHQTRWTALQSPPPDRSNVAAPYLTRLPSGETLLSVQTNVEEARWHRMAVFIGDEHAKGFTNRTLPFGLPPESNAQWNSLFVKDGQTVFALTNASIQDQRGLWCIEGRMERSAP